MSCDCSVSSRRLLMEGSGPIDDAEREKFDKCNEAEKILHDREIEMFAQFTENVEK